MKSKQFFKQLDAELRAITPPPSARLNAEPIAVPVSEPETECVPAAAAAGGGKAPFFASGARRRVLALALAGVLVCGLILGILLALPRGAVSVLQLNINPSVSLVLDEQNVVTAVVSGNGDGDTVLMSGEGFADSLIGKTGQEAAEALADRAAQTGFIDVANAGGAEEYNAVSLTLTGKKADERAAQAIADSLAAHFREEGIYLYASASVEREDASALAAQLSAKETLYYERIAEAESLEAYAETSACEYAEALLSEALGKYDLFRTLEALNGAIEADEGNPLGFSYWICKEFSDKGESLADLCAQAEQVLLQMKVRFGAEIPSYPAFLAQQTFYAFFSEESIAALRGLQEAGIREETFGGLENLSLRVDYYEFVGADLLKSVFDELFDGETGTIEELLDTVAALAAGRAQALYLRFSAVFALPREPIGDADYAAFLDRIGK